MDSLSSIDHHHINHASGGGYDKGAKNSSSYSIWNNFFLAAGIPNNVANEYAVTFAQHRIRIDMLKEITKEILLDMGIKAMGDIIAILRHAKNLYTQDELNGGLTKASSVTGGGVTGLNNSSGIMTTPRPTTVNHSAQRTPVTTTSRLSPIVTSLTTGTKIQSRISLNSGALIASSNNNASIINNNNNNSATTQHPHQQHQQNATNNKRPASTISSSLAKRLRPAGIDAAVSAKNVPEKTLTVHYPSGSAIARAQQRLMANNSSSAGIGNNSSSIKSRLGTGLPDSATRSRSEMSSNNFEHNRKAWSNKASDSRNGTSRSFSNNNNNNKASSSSTKRVDRSETHHHRKEQQPRQQPGRLKSTVFKRLGEGAR